VKIGPFPAGVPRIRPGGRIAEARDASFTPAGFAGRSPIDADDRRLNDGAGGEGGASAVAPWQHGR
jgi:hypothetical protein